MGGICDERVFRSTHDHWQIQSENEYNVIYFNIELLYIMCMF